MFINNKYTLWYFSIIRNALPRSLPKDIYRERHHIIPRCMGGDNTSSNLVDLTAKEHYLVHRLLPKMTQGQNSYKLMVAFWRMCSPKDGRHIPSPRSYESAKQNMAMALSVLNKGKPLPAHQKAMMQGKPAHNKGKPMPPSHGEKIRQYRKDNPDKWLETRKKQAETLKSRLHIKRSTNKGISCPKFRWVLCNQKTAESEETTNLTSWCQSKGFNSAEIYKGTSPWFISAKFRLKDNSRLV